ncbi:MAG: amidohydrolase [Faecousia sp.]
MKTIYHHAAVYTGQLPLVQAFVVQDGKFTFAGTDAEALKLFEEGDAAVDLGGAFVCPGFIDSHMHLLGYGQSLCIAQLADHCGSRKELLNFLRENPLGRGGWILGRGWNQDFFSDGNWMPTRWELDTVSTTQPICITRACGHALSVNSKALELLGITADTPQVEGGQIVLENGVPNGVFLDNAMELVQTAIPDPGAEDLKNMLRSGCRALNAYGITSIHSDDFTLFSGISWREVRQAYRELEEAGELTVRVYEQSNFSNLAALREFVEAGNVTGSGSERFRIGPLKLVGDGALGAHTAYLCQPYADDPGNKGLSVYSQEEFDTLIGYANAHGMQVAIHAIGDACLDMVLGSIEKALTAHPRVDPRHGIVHCQITRPDQLEKIAQMGLHVYAQSIFLDYDIHIVEPRVGKTLAQSSYCWKTLMDKGVTVSNGSDCPVELPRALAGIQCAVTRTDLKGSVPPYLEDEAFTVQQALDSFTQMGAYASFEEHVKGRIQPGMLADFVVLGENPFTVAPSEIQHIPVLATFLGGQAVYQNGTLKL